MIVEKLKDKSGMGKILGCVILLVLLIIFLAISENTRNYMTATGCRNGLESTATSIATNNNDEIYRCQREGYFSAYTIKDTGDDTWSEKYEEGDLAKLLESNLGVKKSGSKYIKKTAYGRTDFILSDVKVKISNPGIAPSEDDKNKETFNVEITAKVKIYPMFKIFGNEKVIDINTGARTGYIAKF